MKWTLILSSVVLVAVTVVQAGYIGAHQAEGYKDEVKNDPEPYEEKSDNEDYSPEDQPYEDDKSEEYNPDPQPYEDDQTEKYQPDQSSEDDISEDYQPDPHPYDDDKSDEGYNPEPQPYEDDQSEEYQPDQSSEDDNSEGYQPYEDDKEGLDESKPATDVKPMFGSLYPFPEPYQPAAKPYQPEYNGYKPAPEPDQPAAEPYHPPQEAYKPTVEPALQPTVQPTVQPAAKPAVQPAARPSVENKNKAGVSGKGGRMKLDAKAKKLLVILAKLQEKYDTLDTQDRVKLVEKADVYRDKFKSLLSRIDSATTAEYGLDVPRIVQILGLELDVGSTSSSTPEYTTTGSDGPGSPLYSAEDEEREYKKENTKATVSVEPSKPTRETILPFPYEHVPSPPQPYRNLPYDAEFITDPFDGIPQRKVVPRGPGGRIPNQRPQGGFVGSGNFQGSRRSGGPYLGAPVYGPPVIYGSPVGLPYPGSFPPGYYQGGFQPDFLLGLPHGLPLDYPPWEHQGVLPPGYFEGGLPFDYAPQFPPNYPYDFPPGFPQEFFPPGLPQGAGPVGYLPSWNPREGNPGPEIPLPNKPILPRGSPVKGGKKAVEGEEDTLEDLLDFEHIMGSSHFTVI